MTRHLLVRRAAPGRGEPLRAPAGATAWSDGSGATEVATWAERGWPADAVRVDDAGLVAWSGAPLLLDPPPAGAADAVRATLDPARARPDHDHLRGPWAAATIEAGGRGRIAADPFGLRPIYWAARGTDLWAGSSAGAVARAAGGARPPKDALATCAIGSHGYRPPGRTGYAGVSALPPGAWIDLHDQGWTIRDEGPPWTWPDDLDGAHPEELLDVVHEEVARAVRAALAAATGPITGEPPAARTAACCSPCCSGRALADQVTFRDRRPPSLPTCRSPPRSRAGARAPHQLRRRRRRPSSYEARFAASSPSPEAPSRRGARGPSPTTSTRCASRG
ncbi:MAG: hypothetical protein R2711_15585 [Acidimicrobiales bacterium]